MSPNACQGCPQSKESEDDNNYPDFQDYMGIAERLWKLNMKIDLKLPLDIDPEEAELLYNFRLAIENYKAKIQEKAHRLRQLKEKSKN
jgi:hypothetical protein